MVGIGLGFQVIWCVVVRLHHQMTYGEVCWRQVQLALMGQCFWYAYLNIVVQNVCYRALYISWMKPSTSIYCTITLDAGY